MKLRNIFLWFSLLSLCLLPGIEDSLAQPVFQRRIFGTDTFSILSQTVLPDNSVVYCGYSIASFAGSTQKGMVIKIDSKGVIEWMRKLECPIAKTAISAYAIVTAPDGSVVLTGQLNDSTPMQKTILANITAAGQLRWAYSYDLGLPASTGSLCSTRDGGYCILGALNAATPKDNFRYVGFQLKTDSLGHLDWCHTTDFPDAIQSSFYRMYESQDSILTAVGYVLVFPDSTNPMTELLSMLQLHPDGTVKRQSLWHSPDHNLEARTLLQMPDGAFIIGGATASVDGSLSGLLVKVKDGPLPEWSSKYSFFTNSTICSLAPKADGTFLGLSVEEKSNGDNAGICVVDESGTMLSAMQMQGRAAFDGSLTILNGQSGYVITTMIGTDSTVRSHLDISTMTPSLQGCAITPALGAVQELPLKDTVLNFSYNQCSIQRDTLPLIVTSEVLDTALVCQEIFNAVASTNVEQQFQVYPNPVSAGTPVTISYNWSGNDELLLRDLSGRELYRTHAQAGSMGQELRLPTANLPAGVYYIEVLEAGAGGHHWQEKIVIK